MFLLTNPPETPSVQEVSLAGVSIRKEEKNIVYIALIQSTISEENGPVVDD